MEWIEALTCIHKLVVIASFYMVNVFVSLNVFIRLFFLFPFNFAFDLRGLEQRGASPDLILPTSPRLVIPEIYL